MAVDHQQSHKLQTQQSPRGRWKKSLSRSHRDLKTKFFVDFGRCTRSSSKGQLTKTAVEEREWLSTINRVISFISQQSPRGRWKISLYKQKQQNRKFIKVPPRFELGSLDSKSRVLTITPWDLAYKSLMLQSYSQQ